MTHAAGYFGYFSIASRACCSASENFCFLKALQAFSYWLLAFEGTPNLIALTLAPRTLGRSHGRQASSSITTGFRGGSGVGIIMPPGIELGCIPGWIGGGPERPGAPPPDGPRAPPDPPCEEPPFCARIGTADNAIARNQDATSFRRAIPNWLETASIHKILYLFLADSRFSF
jgi:hypothetical protein